MAASPTAASPTAVSVPTAASVQFLARRAGKRAEEAFERSREIPGEIVTDFVSHLRNAPGSAAQQALGAPHAVFVDVLADGLAEELPKTLIELVLIDADAASKRMQRGRIDELAFDDFPRFLDTIEFTLGKRRKGAGGPRRPLQSRKHRCDEFQALAFGIDTAQRSRRSWRE